MIPIKRGKKTICNAKSAHTFFQRFMGLMLRKKLQRGEGLLIEYAKYLRSREVHGFFMLITIDLIFIDHEKKVTELATLRPWKVYNPKSDCKWVLEVNEGFIKEYKIRLGDQLSFP